MNCGNAAKKKLMGITKKISKTAYSGLTNLATSLRTMGATNITAGKATTKAKSQACNQILRMSGTRPTLNKLITSDIKQDINSARTSTAP